MIHFDQHVFQLGWNHQLGIIYISQVVIAHATLQTYNMALKVCLVYFTWFQGFPWLDLWGRSSNLREIPKKQFGYQIAKEVSSGFLLGTLRGSAALNFQNFWNFGWTCGRENKENTWKSQIGKRHETACILIDIDIHNVGEASWQSHAILRYIDTWIFQTALLELYETSNHRFGWGRHFILSFMLQPTFQLGRTFFILTAAEAPWNGNVRNLHIMYPPGNESISYQTWISDNHRLKSAGWEGICYFPGGYCIYVEYQNICKGSFWFKRAILNAFWRRG